MRNRLILAAAVAAIGVVGVIAVAVASGGGDRAREKLTGYEEIPTLSTSGEGTFKATIDRRHEEIDYVLTYRDLESEVTQAHIHLGAPAFSGGIIAFLCTNLGNGPTGTPECPPQPGRVAGTIEPGDVVGPVPQGIAAGEFDELVNAMRADATYANVHSANYQAGEIRGQIELGGGSND